MSGDEAEDIIDILERGKKEYQQKQNVMKNIMADTKGKIDRLDVPINNKENNI